jgi:hypothetical protein
MLGGPTFEVFTGPDHHYPPEMYPPLGWAEVPSKGLTAFRKKQKDDAETAELEALLKKEEAEKAAAQEADVAAQPPASVTVAPEPAGAPVSDVTPAMAPAVESEASKKSSGKKKLV